jgi:hypothetical protein
MSYSQRKLIISPSLLGFCFDTRSADFVCLRLRFCGSLNEARVLSFLEGDRTLVFGYICIATSVPRTDLLLSNAIRRRISITGPTKHVADSVDTHN